MIIVKILDNDVVADNDVDEICNYRTSMFAHYIEVESGSTVVRDVKVAGNLPQCPSCTKFECDQSAQQSHKWESKIVQLTGQYSEKVHCRINISSNQTPQVRFQCASVQYEDVWNPGSWCNCQQNLPIEIVLKIK